MSGQKSYAVSISGGRLFAHLSNSYMEAAVQIADHGARARQKGKSASGGVQKAKAVNSTNTAVGKAEDQPATQ